MKPLEPYPSRYRVYWAAQSMPGKGSTLVLSDVTESSAIAGHIGEALTAAHAMPVIEQLARIHAHFWGKADHARAYHWLGHRYAAWKITWALPWLFR